MAHDLYVDFTAAYPEFKETPEQAVSMQLDLATSALCERALKKRWRHAVFLRVAHYLSLRYGTQSGMSTSGVVTSVSASTGGMSQSSSVNALVTGDNPINADFGRTGYGLEYLSLLSSAIPAGFVVR